MADTSTSQAPQPTATGSPWRWLLPALTFVAGAAVASVVFAATNGGEDESVTADARASASPASPASVPSPAGLVVTVPQACLDAADGVSRTSQEVRTAIEAVRDLDARRLQEIVDRIQALQPEVEALAETCRASAGARLEDGTLASSAPDVGENEVPTPTPTP